MQQINTKIVIVVFLVTNCANAWQDGSSGNDLIEDLLPGQSCYYQKYNKCLTCHCHSIGTSAKLKFQLGHYVSKQGSDIRQVRIQNCQDLYVQLDLRGIDATNVPINFRNIQKVSFEKVSFEPSYSDAQELELSFYNVEKVVMEGLNVRDTLKIKAQNVKEAIIKNSTFAHIPVKGVSVSMAKVVDIRDSLFTRISRRSIVIETTKYVYVTNNEMTLNAFEVVYAKDGSELILSCNRMLGQRVSPECDATTTTTTTTTTATSTTTISYITDNPNILEGKSATTIQDDDSNMAEIIGGVVGGLMVIIIVLLIILLFRKNKMNVAEEVVVNSVSAKEEQPMTFKDKNQSKEESDSLLENDNDDDEPKAKFASPVWLDEIQRNKIFNKQKSLLSEDNLAELTVEKSAPDHEQADQKVLEDNTKSDPKDVLAESDEGTKDIANPGCEVENKDNELIV